MAVCAEYRVPHSEFLLWSELDQDKALAYYRFKQSVCTQCGTEENTWVVRDEEGRTRPILPPPLEPETYRCFGCELIQKAQADVPNEEKGVYVRLTPTTEQEE